MLKALYTQTECTRVERAIDDRYSNNSTPYQLPRCAAKEFAHQNVVWVVPVDGGAARYVGEVENDCMEFRCAEMCLKPRRINAVENLCAYSRKLARIPTCGLGEVVWQARRSL